MSAFVSVCAVACELAWLDLMCGVPSSTALQEKMLNQVKKEARLVHYCLTPLLFSPTWRLRVAQVRDHTLDASCAVGCPADCPATHDQPPTGQVGVTLTGSLTHRTNIKCLVVNLDLVRTCALVRNCAKYSMFWQ